MDGDEDPQSAGTEESAPDVQKEVEKNAELFQEQRGRKPKKKQAARAEGGEISSCTHSRSGAEERGKLSWVGDFLPSSRTSAWRSWNTRC